MAYLLVCVKTEDTIYDRAVFSKDLAPVKFDKSEVGIALRHDPCTNSAQYFVIHRHTHHGKVRQKQNSVKNIENGNQTGSETSLENKPKTGTSQICSCNGLNMECSCQSCDNNKIAPNFSLVLLDTEYKIVTKLKSDVAYESFQEMSQSKVFREGFINFMRKNNKLRDVRRKHCSCESVLSACELSIRLPWLLEVCLEPAISHVCYAWNEKVGGLVQKRMVLEETMAWLSTLGGGYSSLGDYMKHFSEEAGRISVTQLKIAMEMGDPIMASKCRLFYALSLMQRGPLSYSKKLIRDEYHFATHFKVRDQRLIDMCRGMWSKLRYMYTRKQRRRLESISCEESATSMSGDHSDHDDHNNQDFCTLHNEEYSNLQDVQELHIYTQRFKEKFGSITGNDSQTYHNNGEPIATSRSGCYDNTDTSICSGIGS